ncbi:MAG: glycosyltransferase family 2 protein [Deltaproteobacteria bacterium CG_4_10_14_3_um_filter_60_8]|nr:MAG: hypothetical protein AUK28_06750 [Desulfobacterales bacterium CG2_30_60_27]PIY22458.1 MAG: glycosyltransferase family 2 protein [Deltaproteobacteria bacterium CG_4_10_14_3_um_filter_60_8]
MSLPISVILLTLNSSATLRPCLDSLRAFAEVVALDNGSTDDTLAILAAYDNVKVYQHPFIGFGALRNLAIGHATYDWILGVDSDEMVSSELCQEIASLALDPQVVYAVPRLNHYQNQPLRGWGWRPDRVIRLFCRRTTGYQDEQVHESVAIPRGVTIGQLKAYLLHYPFNNPGDIIDKMQRYSSLFAAQHRHTGKSATPAKAFSRLFTTFLTDYLLHGYIRDGYGGLLLSVGNAAGAFFKYCKLYEMNRP